MRRKIQREVTLLSRLTHPNIVRYFASWTEASAKNSNSEVELDCKSEEESDLPLDSFDSCESISESSENTINHYDSETSASISWHDDQRSCNEYLYIQMVS
jgi:hypothetical protein